MMIKILFFAVAFLWPVITFAQPPLTVDGNQLLSGDNAITLRGVSLCSLEWHKPLDQIRQVSSSADKWNVNVLRLPVQIKEWDRVGPSSYLEDYLDPAVKLCTDNDVYCIIDWHEIAEWDDKDVQNKLENFWKIVAPRYAANPNIIYEIFNEPTKPETRDPANWAKWRDIAQAWVDQIRKVAPDTLLLIGSPRWSQMPALAVDNPVKGKNIAYTMHLYPNQKQNEWDNLFGEASKHIPIFMTEWGWSNKPDAFWVIRGDQETFGNPLKNYLEDKKSIHWTAWSYDHKCAPAMLGDDKDMAAFVKRWLETANP